MNFPIKAGAPAHQKTACAILPVFEGKVLTGPTREIDLTCNGLLTELLKSGDASAKEGQTLLVPRLQGAAAERVLLVGCGKRTEFNAKRLRRALTTVISRLKDSKLKVFGDVRPLYHLEKDPLRLIYQKLLLQNLDRLRILYRLDHLPKRP